MRIGRPELARLIEQAQRLEEFEEATAAAARSLPAGPAAVIEFLEIPIGGSFDVPPEQAIAYFKAKGLKPSFSYLDMSAAQHDGAFTVAKMMHVDMLAQVRDSLDSALANGTPFKEWADTITPILQSGGWWGRKAVVDPLTGQQIVAQLGSPWRLETIFRTNMQTAYAAGAWQEIEAQKEIAPYLMYDAIDDDRTRASHAAWDRRVLPVDHPWWATHMPPNGYNCRCGVIQLSKDELDALGLQQSPPPKDGSYTWQNPRTGEELQIPNGLDPGFANNPGETWAWKSKHLAKEKAQALKADMRQAAEKLLKEQVAEQGMLALQAQQAAAKAAADAALKRAKALADEKAAQWGAAQQLEAIAKGQKEALGLGAQYKIQALAELKKAPGWAELKPTERLASVEEKAAALKAKAVLNSALHTYKKAVLAGKVPPPASVKALKGMPQADADAFLAKLDGELKAVQAKKAAEEAAAAAAAAKEAEADAASAQPAQASLAIVDGTPPNPDAMVVVARKTKGGTEGAFYQDTETGTKWLVKFNGSEDAVRNEVLASKLYHLAGVEAPELHAITIGGRPALASRVVDGIKEAGAKVLATTPSVLDGFAVDAWLANWDVVGLNFDNVVLIGGRAMRIDVGGSLRYRAIGGLKGSAFGPKVGEIDSLRAASAAQARQVFGAMTPEQIEASVERVLAISEADIRAVVQRYGPPDAATRAELADVLVARRADLEARYPAAAERVRTRRGGVQPPREERVTAEEQAAVEASRANGYGFKTDTDQVEDQMVVVNTLTDADGNAATRGWLKARPEAAARLHKAVKAAAGEEFRLDTAPAFDAVLTAVKGINTRAAKGWEAKDIARIDEAVQQVSALRAAFDSAVRGLSDAQRSAAKAAVEELEQWAGQLRQLRAVMKPGGTGQPLAGRLNQAQLRTSWAYTIGQQEGAVKWVRKPGFEYAISAIEKGRIKLTKQKYVLPGPSEVYEATLPGGTRVTFVPDTAANGVAMRGTLQIDAPGAGIASTEEIFSTIKRLGFQHQRSTIADREDLYLNAFVRLKFARKPAKQAAFLAIDNAHAAGPDRTRAKLAWIKKEAGVDVEASEGWRQRDGQYQAFGHGRARQLRPDLDTPEFEAFAAESQVYHDPNYCKSRPLPVWEHLRIIVDAGGQFASLTDRARRGVRVSDDNTASASRDMHTGGGSYYFTRIQRKSGRAAGFYWKPRVLKRMDAVTYDSDLFGNVSDEKQRAERWGATVQELANMRAHGSNETIFKDSLSLFDDLDFVKFESAAARDQAIKEMKARGYAVWPDGRKIEEVFK